MNRNPQPSAAPATLAGPNLDDLADAITYGILLACVAELGWTRRAVAAAYAAVALTDAIEEVPADARAVHDL
jgi:hypothetical protein